MTVFDCLTMNQDKFNHLLISFLAQERCLYDPVCTLYNNINERHQAYIRIGKQLRECGASEVQGGFSSLAVNFFPLFSSQGQRQIPKFEAPFYNREAQDSTGSSVQLALFWRA